jgi:hypothetical protein
VQPRERPAAVEDRGARREHHRVRGDVARRGPEHRAPAQPAELGAVVHPEHPHALGDPAAPRDDVGRERPEHVERVDLRLIREADRAGHRQRQVGAPPPADRDPGAAGGLELRLDAGAALGGRGVGERLAPLVRHLVVVEVAQQPVHALGAALRVRPDHPVVVPLGQPREPVALQQADLRRAAPGRARADRPGLEDEDPAAGAGEQEGGGQPGQPGADHDHVGGRVARVRDRPRRAVVRVGRGLAPVPPQRGPGDHDAPLPRPLLRPRAA